MVGTKLVLIVQNTDSEGKSLFKRLDTNEIVNKERIHMIKQPPLIFHLDYPFNLPMYVHHIKGFRERANALLVGGMMGDKDNIYYSASYCKI